MTHVDWAAFGFAMVSIIGAIGAAVVAIINAIHGVNNQVTAAKDEVKQAVTDTTNAQTQTLIEAAPNGKPPVNG